MEFTTVVRGALRRAERLISQHGAVGTLGLIAARLMARLRASPPPRQARDGKEFDRLYGVDTSSTQAALLCDMGAIDGPNWRHGTKYEGARAEHLRLIDELPIRHEDFVFVDLGSGKGRVLFHAANRPFRRVIGVEYSRRLHEAAVANLGRYKNPARRCGSIEPVCGDAAAFAFPPEPTVLFLFNPFERRVVELVTARIVRSLRERPRPLLVLYCNAVLGELFRAAGFRERGRWTHDGMPSALYEWPESR